MLSVEQRLNELGIVLPPAPGPAARYVDCVVVGNILEMSGKGPAIVNNNVPCGKLGVDYSTEEGYEFARLVGVNMLTTLKSYIDFDKIERVISIQGFINADPNFTEHHLVLNGLSDLLIKVFGDEAGQHVRSVTGANSLRDNLPIIATGRFLLKS